MAVITAVMLATHLKLNPLQICDGFFVMFVLRILKDEQISYCWKWF